MPANDEIFADADAADALSQGFKHGENGFSKNGFGGGTAPLHEFLDNPPEWFLTQARLCVQQGAPERLLNPLANAVSTHLFGSPWRWQEVLPAVAEKLEEMA